MYFRLWLKNDWLLPCLHYLQMWLAAVVVVQQIWLDTVVFVHVDYCCVCIGYRRTCTTNLIGFYRVNLYNKSDWLPSFFCSTNLNGYCPIYTTNLMKTDFNKDYLIWFDLNVYCCLCTTNRNGNRCDCTTNLISIVLFEQKCDWLLSSFYIKPDLLWSCLYY